LPVDTTTLFAVAPTQPIRMTSLSGDASSSAPAPAAERRRNAALRKLIDEMLVQVRGLQRENEAWTPQERATAEAELDRILNRVRTAAVARDGEPSTSP
jgi:hypothetical protein